MTPLPSPSTAIARVLGSHLGVAPTYRHVPKQVSPGEPLELPAALLKWYEVHPVDRPVAQEVSGLARKAFNEGGLSVEGFGFVVLHRCGDSFYFLIASTWRNENELWETVWYKDGDMSEFAPFTRQIPHVPTFCVAVLHPADSPR